MAKLNTETKSFTNKERTCESADMIVIYLLLLICFVHVESTDATSEHGPGYVGCYPFGHAWQNVFENHKILTSVDDCVSHCNKTNKSYAAISIRSCYCSNNLAGVQIVNGLADVSKVSDSYCNVNCNSNPLQICGSCRHYSVYNTMERLRSPGFNSSLNEATYVQFIDSDLESASMPGHICPTCVTTSEKDSNANNECTEEVVYKCCSCRRRWLRIVIDVAVILGVSFLIILIFLAVRLCVRRRNFRSPPARHDDARADVTNPRRAVPILCVTQSTQTSIIGGSVESHTGTLNIGEQGSSNNPISGLQHLPEGNDLDLTRDPPPSSNFLGHTYSDVIMKTDELDPMRDRTPFSNCLGHTYSDFIMKTAGTDVTAPIEPSSSFNDNEGADINIIHSNATFTTKDHPATSSRPEHPVHQKVEASGRKKSVVLDTEGYAQLLKGDDATFPDQNLDDFRQNTSKRSPSQRGPSQRGITVQDKSHVGGAQGGLRHEEQLAADPHAGLTYENRDM